MGAGLAGREPRRRAEGVHRRADGGVRAVRAATVVLGSSLAELCAQWPPTPKPEAVPYAGPDVPVLSSPAARTCARRWRAPAAPRRSTRTRKLLAVPGVGHSVLSTDFTGCAAPGLVAFLRAADRRAVRTAAATRSPAAPYAPAHARRACAPRGLTGLRRPDVQRGHA